MDRTGKTRCSATDMISNLPSNLIEEILKYLPLRDAVRTSILSRRWQYQWTTIPYLVFDQNFKEKLLDKYNIESIIYQVLVLHKGPIVQFIHSNIGIRRPSLDHWLNFLLNHHIEYLKLRDSKPGVYERMPLLLFSFDQLKSLSLWNCELTPPSELPTFGKLVKLVLSNVRIKPGPLSRFIDKCPLLRSLHLLFFYSNNSMEEVKIGVPNLERFLFGHRDGLPKICIKRTTLLKEVGIHLCENSSLETSQSNLIGFLGQLSSIKVLTISQCTVKLIARAGVASKFPNKFINLGVLRLISIDFCNLDVISCVVCLITSFRNLRRLDILACNIDSDDGGVKPVVEFIKGQHNSKLINLECVAMNGFSCSEPEMEFVKLILTVSTALKKLELKLNHCFEDAAEVELRMLKELARFRRASTKAEIIIT